MDKMPRVSYCRRGEWMLPLLGRRGTRLFDVLGNRIDQVHLISALGEPAGVGSCSASCVEDG